VRRRFSLGDGLKNIFSLFRAVKRGMKARRAKCDAELARLVHFFSGTAGDRRVSRRSPSNARRLLVEVTTTGA